MNTEGLGLGAGDVRGAIRHLTGLAEQAEIEQRLDVAAVARASIAIALSRSGDTDTADEQVGRAFALASESGSLQAKVMVALRYIVMLNILDRPGEARAYSEQVLAGMREEDPVSLRLEIHQVSSDVAAACGDWPAVREHSGRIADLAGEDVAARVQALVAGAAAAARYGDLDQVEKNAVAALRLARPGLMDGHRVAALSVLQSTNQIPTGVDLVQELRDIASRAHEGGDSAGESAARITLGRSLLDISLRDGGAHLHEARSELTRAIKVARSGNHVFATAKALILRATTRAGQVRAVQDVATGWKAATQVVDSVEDPVARQRLLVDLRSMADQALEALPHGARPLDELAARVAYDIFDTTTLDVLEQSRRGAGLPPQRVLEVAADDHGERLSRWKTALAGRPLIAFRVVRANAECLTGWRLSVDEDAQTRLEPFMVEGAPAFEIKLIAERNPTAPTNERVLWERLATSLLPRGWAFAGKRLIIVPHGPLWLLPWAALRDGSTVLASRVTVTLAPTLSAMSESPPQVRSSPSSVVIAADEELPGARAEIDHLVQRLGSRAAAVATFEELAVALARKPDLLLLSSHGQGLSAEWTLQLRQIDLRVEDLARLDLPRIVVAASCLSARQGFEPWPPTFVSSALAAGVSVVIGGIWDLPDESTSSIVRDLVDFLFESNLPAEEALRAAQVNAFESGATVRQWAGLVAFVL